jgi:5-methylcytosine-specific restriction protein A
MILKRDPLCKICDRAASTEVDHITPKALDGTDDEANLQGLCESCHRQKTQRETHGLPLKPGTQR